MMKILEEIVSADEEKRSKGMGCNLLSQGDVIFAIIFVSHRV